MRKERCVKKVGKHLNFFAKSNDLKHAYLSDLPMILLVYKEAFFNSDDLDSCVPSVVKVLLQEFEDFFRMTFLVICRQLEVLSIKLTLFQEHLYQIGRLIEAILKRLRSFKGKWRS